MAAEVLSGVLALSVLEIPRLVQDPSAAAFSRRRASRLLAASADLCGVADIDPVQQLRSDPLRAGVDRLGGGLGQELCERPDHALGAPPQVIHLPGEIPVSGCEEECCRSR